MAKRPFQRKDRFYQKAKTEGYPARSAYKIMELDDRFKIFKQGTTVVDLGCAPGGWLKVAEERLGGNGTLVGIDLLPLQFSPRPKTKFLQDDFTKEESREWIKSQMKGAGDWILSDLSPNISGIKFRDTYESANLCQLALEFARDTLNPGGNFLCKAFPGQEVEEFRKEIKKFFKKIVTVVPEATRRSSSEIYLICLELKAVE